MLKRKQKFVLAVLSIALGALIGLIGWDVYSSSRQVIYVPVLRDDGNVGVQKVGTPSLFGLVTRKIAGKDRDLNVFDLGETVFLKKDEPDDAALFACPPGTDIPVSKAVSHWDKKSDKDVYFWGEYEGDEGARLKKGEKSKDVFKEEKFKGRAKGFEDIVKSDRSLVVNDSKSQNGIFFVSADVPEGDEWRVRCSEKQVCGDLFVDDPEQCDEGSKNSDTLPDACRTGCTRARCGDGVADSGEQCDDGNQISTDSCTNACKVAGCGDGFVQGSEECDDANNTDTDACRASCKNNVCGDGVVNTDDGDSACDDGNTEKGDGCSRSCEVETGYRCDEDTAGKSTCKVVTPDLESNKEGDDQKPGDQQQPGGAQPAPPPPAAGQQQSGGQEPGGTPPPAGQQPGGAQPTPPPPPARQQPGGIPPPPSGGTPPPPGGQQQPGGQ